MASVVFFESVALPPVVLPVVKLVFSKSVVVDDMSKSRMQINKLGKCVSRATEDVWARGSESAV